MKTEHAPSNAELRALLEGTLPPRRAEALRVEIRHDLAARDRYDRLADAQAALEGAVEGLSVASRERIRARLFDTPAARPASRVLGWRVGFGGLAGGLAAGLILAVLGVSPDEPGASSGVVAPAYQARSGDGPGLSMDRVLQVFRVAKGEDGAIEVAPARALSRGDHVRFAAMRRDRDGLLSLVAVRDEERRVIAEGLPLAASSTPRRVPVAYTIPDGWSGSVRFVAVFHPEPVALEVMALAPRDEEALAVRAVSAEVRP